MTRRWLAWTLFSLTTPLGCSDDTPPRRTTKPLGDGSTAIDSATDGPAESARGKPDAQRPARADAGPPVACRNSLDCRNAPGGKGICDSVDGFCVECASDNDCSQSSNCILNACVPFTPCTNSLDCPNNEVCDRGRGRCVECASAADCAQGFVCVNSFCLLACQSDRQCTPFSLLCDTAAGHCVQCLRDVDCPDAQYCLVGPGSCVADRCVQGAATCRNGAISRCAANGSSVLAPEPCGQGETCVESGSGAACIAATCAADASCDGGP